MKVVGINCARGTEYQRLGAVKDLKWREGTQEPIEDEYGDVECSAKGVGQRTLAGTRDTSEDNHVQWGLLHTTSPIFGVRGMSAKCLLLHAFILAQSSGL
jgi:hypothetical protein